MSDGRARPWGLDNTKYHEKKKNRCTCRIFPLKISPEKLNRPSLQNSFRLCSIPAEALRLVNEPKHLRLSMSKEFKRFESLHAIKNKTKNFGMFFRLFGENTRRGVGAAKGWCIGERGKNDSVIAPDLVLIKHLEGLHYKIQSASLIYIGIDAYSSAWCIHSRRNYGAELSLAVVHLHTTLEGANRPLRNHSRLIFSGESLPLVFSLPSFKDFVYHCSRSR